MERSTHSNIVATTRLIEHFSNENVIHFRQHLMEQLECNNEQQYLIAILRLMKPNITHELSLSLKSKAMEIGDKQRHTTLSTSDEQGTNNSQTHNPNNTRSNTNYPCTNTITLNKKIQQQYNDNISVLNSDLIDELASYLNKKQSIEFGYLNRQCYIETQKISYLLKRRNITLSIQITKFNTLFLI